ncbi:SRPBCC family protein [Amycolatopsis taiwanensis]|uniref:SRPBCC family protein n=1 Tax=Amycolatopsis taiwanensis TaxID=342230 RepID=UPI0004B909AE|nr:SRPBCC family protein [Amycolatopsis taiwanensis]
MGRIDGEIVIGRTMDAVFDFVADQRNELLYNPAMTSAQQVTGGPIGKGTRFVAFAESMGHPLEMTIEFTDFDRPRRLSSRTTTARADVTGTLIFEPVPGGTRMRWSWRIRVKGLRKLIAPVLVAVARRQEKTIWASLKRHLETTTLPQVTVPLPAMNPDSADEPDRLPPPTPPRQRSAPTAGQSGDAEPTRPPRSPADRPGPARR